jgi:hypothetical protein
VAILEGKFGLVRDLIFKLEEEGKPALLLLLPKVFAEDCFFASASVLGCGLVVERLQAAV